MGKGKRIVIWTAIAAMAGFLLLSIPDSEREIPTATKAAPFLWDQDDYWESIEATYRDYMSISLRVDHMPMDRKANVLRLIDSCRATEIGPNSECWQELETAFFELAPSVAGSPGLAGEYLKLQQEIRSVVKDQSRNWDMTSPEARDRLYRLLYGSRTAVEEVLLQGDPDSMLTLVMSTDEPSATPSAVLEGVTVHSGDILVSRGGAATSALIARGNDYPGNFSHVAFVHVDEHSGEISIIESHIEIGVAVASVADYMRDTKLRILVLRLRADLPGLETDPMLPHKAATLALERARREHIAYDFEMDYRDDRKLFCSEVVSAPYREMGLELWMGISHISSPGVRAWLAAFGVRHFETQEPSDLEYDPQLRVVAEWRDPETLWKDHVDNAVIDAMLEDAETGERITYDWYKLPAVRIMKAYSMLKNWFGGVGPIPEGMSATSALKNDSFSKSHTGIKSRLLELAGRFRDAQGYAPPYWELVKLARQAKSESES
jgi:hypothetical protein